MRGVPQNTLCPLRRRNWAAVVTLLMLAAGSWAFIELAGEVLEGDTQAFDEWVLKSLRKPDDPHTAIGPWWLRHSVRDVSALGGVTVLTLLTVTVAGFCGLIGNWRAMWTVLAAAAGGQTLSSLLKYLLSRQRPEVVPHFVDVSSASFPSGHAMVSAAVYLTLGILLAEFVERRCLKTYLIGVAIVLTVVIGASRVYLGVHYPTDVLAGWTAGAMWAVLCGYAAVWIRPR
jgi:undecaprenyl-diphosphatase